VERPKLRHGILGGLLGGLVFAGIMLINGTLNKMGMLTLPLIGRLVGSDSAWIGFLVHMVNSAVIGAGYILIFGRIEKGMVDGLHFGMIYGAIWWFIGPLTLMPKLLGEPIGATWNFDTALGMFPSFIGHIVYGAILGLTVGAARDMSLPIEAEGPRPPSEQTTERLERPVVRKPRKHIPLFIRRRPAPGTEDPGAGD